MIGIVYCKVELAYNMVWRMIHIQVYIQICTYQVVSFWAQVFFNKKHQIKLPGSQWRGLLSQTWLNNHLWWSRARLASVVLSRKVLVGQIVLLAVVVWGNLTPKKNVYVKDPTKNKILYRNQSDHLICKKMWCLPSTFFVHLHDLSTSSSPHADRVSTAWLHTWQTNWRQQSFLNQRSVRAATWRLDKALLLTIDKGYKRYVIS